jgi:hypothetical protein
MASSSSRSRKDDGDPMRPARIPLSLSGRLGDEASNALADLLEESSRVCTDTVMMQCAERFERRLLEETSRLRLEMHEGFSTLRQEMKDSRFELLKWAFMFWVGQLVGVTAIVSVLLRTVPGR